MTTPRSRTWVFKANRLVEAGRLDDAISAFRAIAESGEPRGWLGLGRCLLRTGDPERLDEAVGCIERAAEGRAWGAAFTAGMLLVDPAVGLLDGSRAEPLLRQAVADERASIAATKLGELLLRGDCGVARDLAAARTHLDEALAIEDEPEAWLLLGEHAEAVGESPSAAAAYWVRGTRSAMTHAHGLPAHVRYEHDAWARRGATALVRMRPALEAAAEGGDIDAHHWLAEAALLGCFDRDDLAGMSDADAHAHVRAAADAGHPRAGFLEWVLAQQGAMACDDPDARLEAAARGGVAEAAHRLAANAFAAGDFDRAVALSSIAADLPGTLLEAIRLAAQAHEERDAAGDQKAAAARWLQAAWARHDPLAMLEIGRRYRDGRGVERDLVQAWRWLMRPMRFGNGSGQREVHEFVGEMADADVRRADLLADGDESWAATFLDQLRDDEACDERQASYENGSADS